MMKMHDLVATAKFVAESSLSVRQDKKIQLLLKGELINRK